MKKYIIAIFISLSCFIPTFATNLPLFVESTYNMALPSQIANIYQNSNCTYKLLAYDIPSQRFWFYGWNQADTQFITTWGNTDKSTVFKNINDGHLNNSGPLTAQSCMFIDEFAYQSNGNTTTTHEITSTTKEIIASNIAIVAYINTTHPVIYDGLTNTTIWGVNTSDWFATPTTTKQVTIQTGEELILGLYSNQILHLSMCYYKGAEFQTKYDNTQFVTHLYDNTGDSQGILGNLFTDGMKTYDFNVECAATGNGASKYYILNTGQRDNTNKGKIKIAIPIDINYRIVVPYLKTVIDNSGDPNNNLTPDVPDVVVPAAPNTFDLGLTYDNTNIVTMISSFFDMLNSIFTMSTDFMTKYMTILGNMFNSFPPYITFLIMVSMTFGVIRVFFGKS